MNSPDAFAMGSQQSFATLSSRSAVGKLPKLCKARSLRLAAVDPGDSDDVCPIQAAMDVECQLFQPQGVGLAPAAGDLASMRVENWKTAGVFFETSSDERGNPRRAKSKQAPRTSRGFSAEFSAIRPSHALGALPNSLTRQPGIHLGLQFHLPPVFRPVTRALT